MDNFRKTLAYKICGYSFFVLVAAAIFYGFYIMASITMWHNLVFPFLILWILATASSIIFVLFIVLSFIAFITKNKYTKKKHNILADIGYVCMFITSFLYTPFLPHCIATIKDEQHARQEQLKKEFPSIKNSCVLLNNHLPKIMETFGTNFTKEQLATELTKMETVQYASAIYNEEAILYYREEPASPYGGITDEIRISYSHQPCDMEKKNCHIYLKMPRKLGKCKFYFDKNGQTIPAEETLQLIQ